MKLTILAYHQIGELPTGAVYPANWVRPAEFSRQLDLLLEAGYTPIHLEQWLEPETQLPPRPVAITFDDGYRSVAEHAWPLLRERGFCATTFLVAGEIGGSNRWDPDELPQRLLDASEVRELAARGMRFGSHGWSHQRMRRLPDDQLRDELRRSRTRLSELLGEEICAVAYPFGSADRRVFRAAREAGYRLGLRGRGRTNPRRTDPLALCRIHVNWQTRLPELRHKLLWERWLRW